MASRGRSAQTGALKKLKYRLVPCFSMRGDKDMRRLAEIDANLLRSPLTRLERLEHLAERELLEKQLRLKLEHGGDRKSSRFQVPTIAT